MDTERQPNAIQIRQHINKTIHILHENVPDSVLIVWKSSGWCASCGWAGDEKVRGKANNYRIYAANDEAQKVIEHLGAPNLVYLDWGREILPRSIGNLRLASNDGNKFHYGLEARLQFLQMLTELYDHQDPTILEPPVWHPVTEKQVEHVAESHSTLLLTLLFVSWFLLLLRTKLAREKTGDDTPFVIGDAEEALDDEVVELLEVSSGEEREQFEALLQNIKTKTRPNPQNRAVNLSPNDKQASLELARKTVPTYISFCSGTFFTVVLR